MLVLTLVSFILAVLFLLFCCYSATFTASFVLLRLSPTFCGLAKVAIFTTNVDAENQTLISHKCVCGALNRHFCQIAVTCWRSSVRYVSCRCQLKYVVKNMILKYVQSNENIMCINVSNFFPFHRSVD